MAHILVVDDDDIVAELASAILIAAGHCCCFVSDAAEAWRLLHWRRPDLLLLDEAMPGAGPGEGDTSFLHRLRGSAEFHDLPVVMFTAQSGAKDSVRKPVEPHLLLRTVDQVLQASRPQEWAEFQLRTRKDGPPRKVYL